MGQWVVYLFLTLGLGKVRLGSCGCPTGLGPSAGVKALIYFLHNDGEGSVLARYFGGNHDIFHLLDSKTSYFKVLVLFINEYLL